jgi:hypothetical protein
MFVDFNIFFIIIFCLKLSMLTVFFCSPKGVSKEPKVPFIKKGLKLLYMFVDFNIFFIIIFCLKLSMLTVFFCSPKGVSKEPKVPFIKKGLKLLYERNP